MDESKTNGEIREFAALLKSLNETEQAGLLQVIQGLQLLANKKAAV